MYVAESPGPVSVCYTNLPYLVVHLGRSEYLLQLAYTPTDRYLYAASLSVTRFDLLELRDLAEK